MSDKLKLDLSLVLPGAPDERDACVGRLTKLLQAGGLGKVHLIRRQRPPVPALRPAAVQREPGARTGADGRRQDRQPLPPREPAHRRHGLPHLRHGDQVRSATHRWCAGSFSELRWRTFAPGIRRRKKSGDQFLGILALADVPRAGVSGVLERLHQLGIRKTIMLTGDNERMGRSIANAVGLDEVKADLLPEDKVKAMTNLDNVMARWPWSATALMSHCKSRTWR